MTESDGRTAEKGKKRPVIFLILGFLANLLGRLLFGLELEIDPKVREWKKREGGFIVLCAHPSEMDAVVLIAALFPRFSRFVVGAQQLYKGWQGVMLRSLKVIPKRQFTPDMSSVKEMIKTVRDGDVLAMMPEGRVSLDGTSSPIDPSTAKLLQKLACPTAVMVPRGTYFVKPSYNYGGLIRGRIGGRLTPLFDEEEAKSLTIGEIMERLTAALSYDASRELQGSGRTYGSRKKAPMEKVSNLFYLCPSCGKLYTVGDEGGEVFCSSCGMKVFAGRDMFLHESGEAAASCSYEADADGMLKNGLPGSIPAWNRIQLDHERSFWEDPGASLDLSVRKKTMVIGKEADYTERCGGTLRLDREGLHYEDPEESFDVKLSILPGVSADYRDGYIAYYEGDLIRRFYFDDRRLSARFMNSLMVLKEKAGS